MKALITLAALMAIPTAVAAQDFSIAVGQPGRGYEMRGTEIAQRIGQHGFAAAVVNYEGSDDISIAVCSGAAQMGIMQIDAIYMRAQEQCKLQVVAEYGNEYAFILFPPDSSMNELSDLDATSTILVDTLGSGTDLFWRNILAIEKEHGNGSSWSDAKPLNGLTFMAGAMAATGEIDAVLLVGNPNSQEVIDLMDAGWDAGELNDKDINDQLFNGKPLYARERVKIGLTGFMKGDTEDAYIVPSFVVVNSDWMMANRTEFQKIARATQ